MREDTKHLTRSAKLSIYSKELLQRKTNAEIAFESILNELGLTYETQKVMLRANAIVDYYVPYLRRAYEIDGSYHDHRKDKDADRSRRIRMLDGVRIVRFTNEEVLNNSKKIKEDLRLRGERLEKQFYQPTEKKWETNLVNSNPKLRFKFRLENKPAGEHIIRRWRKETMKKSKFKVSK